MTLRDLSLAVLLSASTAAGLYAATASLPFFSESYTHLATTARFSSIWDSFDLALIPLRPAQHAFFYLLQRWGLDDPASARLLPFALHAIAGVLVLVLARQLGCGRGAGFAAMIAFLAFPNVKGLVWVAAISGPGRVVCALAGLCCLVRHRRAPTWWSGPMLLAALFVGLGFHQGSFLLAGYYVLLAMAIDDSSPTACRRLAKALRDPWLLTGIATVALYLFYVVFLRTERHHRVSGDAAALAANAVKATLSMLPEVLRAPAIDGLRGHHGGLGRGLGFAICAVVVLMAAVAFWRGSRRLRFVIVAIGAELALPALTSGFVGRYCHLASGLLACGVMSTNTGERGARVRVFAMIAVVVLGWTWDTLADVREYRSAGVETRRVLDAAAGLRKVVGREPIALVDLPEMWGAERDIPLFNWGTREALTRRGVSGPWRLLRTVTSHLATDFTDAPAASIAALPDAGTNVLVYERETSRLRVERRR